MNTIYKKIKKSWLAKNLITLRLKFIHDKWAGKNKFLFAGESVKKISPTKLPLVQRKRILFPTIFFLDRGLAWQITIAKALEVRGHEVIFMPLDLRFPRRNALYFDVPDRGFATSFYNLYTRTLLESFSLPIKAYSQFGDTKKFNVFFDKVKSLKFEECKNFTYQSLPLGKMAFNQLIHFFRCRADKISEKQLNAYKDFLAMGMVLYHTISNALETLKPDIIFTLNGSFLDSQLQLALGKARGIRVITFEAGFMLNSLMLGIDEPIIEFPMTKYLPPGYQDYILKPQQEKQLDQYLCLRSQGKDCVFDYWGKPLFDEKKIRLELGIDEKTKPDILFTNLLWDSTTITSDIAFNSQLEWIISTVKFYQEHPKRILLIRVHPAEINPPFLESTDKIQDLIREKLAELPKNVIIIPSSSLISSYPLTEISKTVLVYSSTAGLEAAIAGKPVIVAGKTHFRNQGFTLDAKTEEEYLRFLEKPDLPATLEQVINLARKYAYFFFFGFMIPFPLVTEKPTTEAQQVSFNFHSEEELLPGKDEGLDFVAKVILDQSDYTRRLRKLIL